MVIQYSIQKMVSDGTLSTIALGIQYLQRNDIYMRIAGEETPQVGAHSGYTWSFINNTTLKILPVVPNGVEVVVYRRTDVNAMYNVFSQNAQFDEATMDENNQQLLYIAQEYLEQGLPGTGIDTIEFVRDDGTYTYYRLKRTDGSYSEEFAVPSVGSATKILTLECIRRSYAEAGLTLVPGSIQTGFTLSNASDVVLDEVSGKCFSGPVGNYTGTPVVPPGFTDKSATLLRQRLVSRADGVGGSTFISLPSDDVTTDFKGEHPTTVDAKLNNVYMASAASITQGTFKTPPELGFVLGPIVYNVTQSGVNLVTNLRKYLPFGYNLGPGAAEAAGMKAYYVTHSGNDSNDGLSWATALASITTAANKADADVVFIGGGRWTISNGFTSKLMTRDLILTAPNAPAFISNQRDTTWSSNGDGTYTSGTLGGTPIRVADLRYTDEFGDPVWLDKKTSLVDVQTTPYSWAVTAGSGSTQVVTINLPLGVPNNSNTLVLRSAPMQVDFNAQPWKFYAKNIHFFGGDSAGMTPKNGVAASVYASEDCHYLSPHLNDCLRVQGVGLVLSFNCKASNGEKDGFNYHAATNTLGNLIQTHFIEVGCISHNHKTTAGTANGSTAHEACVGIRLGTQCGYGIGPGIADINDSKTYNVGVFSNFNYGDPNAKGFLPANNCTMWLHNCGAVGNRTADFSPQDNSTMYVRGSFAGVYATGAESHINKF